MAMCGMISDAIISTEILSAVQVRPACNSSESYGFFADTSCGVSFFSFFRFFSFAYYCFYYFFSPLNICSTGKMSELQKRMFSCVA